MKRKETQNVEFKLSRRVETTAEKKNMCRPDILTIAKLGFWYNHKRR